MTQILVHRCPEGIVLAADSRAVSMESGTGGPRRHMEVRKIFPLTHDIVMTTAGAGYGIQLCWEFQAHARRSALHDFTAVTRSALALLPSRLAEVRAGAAGDATLPELDRVYIVMAAHDPDGADSMFPLVMLASEERGDPLHQVPAPDTITIPRQVTLEYRLAQAPVSHRGLDAVEHDFERFLLKLAASDDDVGPPFHLVRIDTHGIQVRIREDMP